MENNNQNNKLVEIKKGQTGTGILIESDGYVSRDLTENNKKIIKEAFEARENGAWNVPNPFVLDVVLQKYGIQNANGRIYPESVLKREVIKYQKLIDSRMALGECYTPNVMILCEDGWKCIANVTENDKVLTLNTNTNEIEIQQVSKKIELEYNGDLIHFEGRNISESVTPNHGFPIYNRYGKFSDFYTAEQILNHEVKDQNHTFIPKQGNWNVKGEEFFILKGINNPSHRLLNVYPDCKEDKLIPMDTFMKFIGIYLSNGDCRKTNNDVNVHQVKPQICTIIEDLYEELGFPYTISINKQGRYTFRISDPRLNQYLRPLGNCHSKYIPFELKQQSRENLRCLYDWFVLGNGRIRGGKRKDKNLTDGVFSVSKQLIFDLNEIQLKIGYSGNYHIENQKQDRTINGRLIKGENCCDLHFSLRSLTKGVYLDESHLKINKIPYDGKVMCIEVPNHTFYVMSNGKCHWSKNCNHPAESTIDLGRISHNIIECHWENHTLVGKIEFNLTEGFRRYGICSSLGDTCANLIMNGYKIGVSSRGIGSVENKLGKTIVCDDFELLCWDIVATPSTPGSYIGHKEELQQYVESDETQEKKPKLNEKINKIKNILG